MSGCAASRRHGQQIAQIGDVISAAFGALSGLGVRDFRADGARDGVVAEAIVNAVTSD
jgi:hypothetical protein